MFPREWLRTTELENGQKKRKKEWDRISNHSKL